MKDGCRLGLVFLLVLGLLGMVTACNLDEEFSEPRPGDECDEEGATSDDLVCKDGRWIRDDDPDPDPDAGPPPDVPCEPESDEDFCERFGQECGDVLGNDNCGEARLVECEQFEGYGCEEPRECVPADQDEEAEENFCACPQIDDIDAPDEEICELLGAQCGELNPGDFCEDWEGFEPVECGECADNDQECGEVVANQCGCPCEINGECYLEGEAEEDNPCQICDPTQSTDEFSPAADGTVCESSQIDGEGACEAGICIGDCVDGKTRCDGEDHCIDLDSDDDHCGSCGNACGDDEVCLEEECECEDSRSVSEICEQAEASCGTVEDICEESVDCGECSGLTSCEDNVCTGCSDNDDCDGCQACDAGTCVDSDANCSGCQTCSGGECVDTDSQCTGCQGCEDGACVDDDSACSGCQGCDAGTCVDNDSLCNGCQGCSGGTCIDDNSQCGADEECTGGLCECVPDCSGRDCGPDPVCGESCGICPIPDTGCMICTPAGSCDHQDPCL